MKSFCTSKLAAVAAVFAAVGLSALPADASFVLELDDLSTPGTDVSIVDGSPGDGNPLTGVVTFDGSVGLFTVNVTTSISKPVIGNPYLAALDLNSVNVSGAAGTLVIETWDTGYTLPSAIPGQNAQVIAEIGGTTNGTVTFRAGVDLTNPPLPPSYPSATSPAPIGPLGPGAFSATDDSVTFLAPISTPFSMSEEVTIVHTAAGQITSFDALVSTVVPEPATILIWSLLGAAGAGLGWWRRRSGKLDDLGAGSRSETRTPWTSENRAAILAIVDRRNSK